MVVNNIFIIFALTIIIFFILKASPAVRFATIRGERLLMHARYRRVQVSASPLLGHCSYLIIYSLLIHPEASGNSFDFNVLHYDFPARREVRGFLQGLSQRGGEAITP